MTYNPLLVLVAAPMIAGLACLIVPDKLKMAVKAVSMAMALGCLALSVYLFINRPAAWQCGSLTVLSLDALSGLIIMGIGFFTVAIMLYSMGYVENRCGGHFGYMLITLGSSFGAALANDVIGLLIFWGVLAVTLYLMINLNRTKEAADSAKRALLIVGATDAAMLFGLCMAGAMAGTFAIDKMSIPLRGAFQYLAYFSIVAAVFAKMGAVPFHSWVPLAAKNAPANVAAYLPASIDKLLGIYLLARVSLDMFAMNAVSNSVLLIIGSVTALFAVVVALVQDDMKKALGYHAVSQVGYIVLGIGTGNPIGIAGALFNVYAVYNPCLFLAAGGVEKNAGTSSMERLGGLAARMPVTFASFLIAAVAMSGIPPFNGFVSKWMLYQGILETAGPKNPLWMLWLSCAMFASAITLASILRIIHAVFMSRPSENMSAVKESNFTMTSSVLLLAVSCAVFGVFAFLFPIDLIAAAMKAPIAYKGIWHPVLAALLIAAGVLMGAAVYYISKGAAFRKTKVFIGGEDASSFDRMSGAEFYNTIPQAAPVSGIYKIDKRGIFDIYTITRVIIKPLTRYFRYLHNGVLPTYLVWCLLGLTAIFAILFLR